MAGIKEIRTRIDSVEQTLKITNAMYLISSSKLRKARQQLNNVQPYFLKITSTISDILHHSDEIEHIYFDKRADVAEHKVGGVVVTGDKDLDAKFAKEAADAGFDNHKGHRSVGGMRASIYNAMPRAGVEKLVEFMEKFEKENA